MNVLDLMRLGPVIPVIVIDDVATPFHSRERWSHGGVRVLEVTLRTPAALDALRAIAQSNVGEAIVGVGTISRPEDFIEAAAAGARSV